MHEADQHAILFGKVETVFARVIKTRAGIHPGPPGQRAVRAWSNSSSSIGTVRALPPSVHVT